MWRERVLEAHQATAGTITSEGPFLGQRIYVPYFWDRYLRGEADEVDDGCPFFRVREEERQEFPELGHRLAIRLRVEGNRILEV